VIQIITIQGGNMKKLFISLFLVSSLVISLAACAMASSSIYVGSMVGSGWKSESSLGDSDGDLGGLEAGLNFASDKLSLGLEYIDGTEKGPANGDTNYNTLRIKGGFNILSNETGHLALTVGYTQTSFDDSDNSKVNGTMVGLDSLDCFGEKARIDCSCSWSVSATNKSDTDPDGDALILLASIKYSYFLADNLGLSIGYRYEQYSFDNDEDVIVKFSGPTAGLTYRF
jgi:opacity protein-like surface antigen